MKECIRAHDILDGSQLGRIGLEELEPRRHVGEEVLDLERHSRQKRSGSMTEHITCTKADARAGAGALDVRHRRNARERLTPETEAGDGIEVRQLRYLAGG